MTTPGRTGRYKVTELACRPKSSESWCRAAIRSKEIYGFAKGVLISANICNAHNVQIMGHLQIDTNMDTET